MAEKITKIINWGIIALAFFLPFFFLSITTEFYLFNKQTLLLFATGILLILWAFRMVEQKSLSFRKTPLDLPILLFTLAYVLVTIFASPNKVEALMSSTSTGTILTLTALYFVITNNFEKRYLVTLLHCFVVSAGLLGLIVIYQFIGFGETFAPVDWMKFKLWTPAGGPLILLTFLLIALSLGLTQFIGHLSGRSERSTSNSGNWLTIGWLFVANLLIALGLIFTIYQVLPGKETSLLFLPYRTSWAIAIEAFKQNPFLGVGPGNYLSAFNRFRPINFNNYDFWNIRFGNAASFPLELLTIGGILAFGAYLFLIWKIGKIVLADFSPRSDGRREMNFATSSSILKVGLLALLAVQLFLPINFLILTSTFIFLALLATTTPEKHLRGEPSLGSEHFGGKTEVKLKGKTPALIALGTAAVLALVSFYFWSRAYAAEFYFRQSLNALVQNRGTDTYNLQIKAISFNPYKENYRVAYSQTNFALANALAGQADLTDQERANISRLIQQAIREAKVATVLNQTQAGHWENLAQIYRNLINFAQGADQWAIAAYQQAIILDPLNPRVRVNLGGLLFGLGNYEEAVRHFQNAVNLKPDYANGYYNLAATYREQEKYLEAFNIMQVVTNLVPVDSADYQQARDELEELRTKLPAAEATPAAAPAAPGEQLTQPEPLPSPVIEPPIELPKEAGPEIGPSPSPSPTLSPSPKATPTP